jgi:hypothetical protein
VAVAVLLIAYHNRPFTGEISVGPDLLLQVMPEEATSQKEIDHTLALNLTTLLRSAREVISHNQDLINEQAVGKDLTATKVIEEAKTTFAKATGHSLPTLDPTSAEGKMLGVDPPLRLESMG